MRSILTFVLLLDFICCSTVQAFLSPIHLRNTLPLATATINSSKHALLAAPGARNGGHGGGFGGRGREEGNGRGGGQQRRSDGGRGRSGYNRKGKPQGGESSKDPEKRLSSLNRKLNSILELEEIPFDDLNEEQRKKVERKEDLLEEISKLTKLVNKQDYIEEAAEERATATSAEDLNDAVVGGKIPRTLMKLLTYCRVSDRDTCEILLELGKVKVNGEVMDNPVALVDLVKDKIEFDGEIVTLPETRLKHKLRSLEDDDVDESVPKDYCARIDGGLLIDKTRAIEKSRGDYIDKSPYIMRQNNHC